MNGSTHIADATISEIVAPPSRDYVLRRLNDWRRRVHRLYDRIEAELGNDYIFDRSGKQHSMEEMVQRAGLAEADVPPVDILRIERPERELRALIMPRTLWVVGANGRLDLTVLRNPGHGRESLILYDLSLPFSEDSDWRLVSPSDSLHQPPFHISTLRELLF